MSIRAFGSVTAIARGRNPLGAIAVLSLAIIAAASCAPVTAPAANWNQANADPGNTNAATYGAPDLQTPKRSVIALTTSGDPTIGSPAVGPNGSVFVPVFDGDKGSASRIIRVEFGKQTIVGVFSTWQGQISTPAVDSSGNVYFVANSFGDTNESTDVVELKSNLVKLDPSGQVLWSTLVLLPRHQTPAPKLLEYNGKVNIFIPLRVNNEIRLGVIDGATGEINSVSGCNYPVENGGGGATVTPSATPIPYHEGPVPAVVVDPATTIPYLVMPTSYCGINFYSLSHDPTNVAWPAALAYPTPINLIDHGSPVFFSSPTLSLFNGYALVAESSGGNIVMYAYDFRSGKQIANWTLQDGYCAVPLANTLNTVLYCAFDRIILSPIDNPNNSLNKIGAAVDGPIATAITVSNVYVRGRDGLFRFDTQMHLQSFAPMAASNGAGIAIGPEGTVYSASSDGKLYVFPSQ